MKKPLSLKVLDSIQVESPCHESWDGMGGDQKRRFCDRCQHSVNNISEMTREEAAALIATAVNQGRLCVRYRRGLDGAIRFKPSRVTFGTQLRRAAVVAVGFLAFMRFTTSAHAENVEQGDVAVPNHEITTLGEMVAITPQPTPAATVAPEGTLPCHTMGSIAVPKDVVPAHPPEVMGKIKAPR